MIPNATPDDDQLILQIPGDGSVASLRCLLNELDDTSIDVEHLSIHSPDLDDVFFAVTGHAPQNIALASCLWAVRRYNRRRAATPN